MTKLLSIEKLTIGIRHPDRAAQGFVLKNIDLGISAGECLALVGESGCGKSVTALAVLGLLPEPPMERVGGSIQFGGQELTELSVAQWRDIRGRKIGLIFQDPQTSLNPVLKIGDQIIETIRSHREIDPDQARREALRLLGEVHLDDPKRVLGQYPHQLSGGMCQRVMVAMALSCGPDLLIADEPTTALDATIQTQILELIFGLCRERRLGLLFITHDLRLVRRYADRVAVLYAGQIVEIGDSREVFEHPRHPYARGLIRALPRTAETQELFNIPGSVPSPFNALKGCAFHERCDQALEKCKTEEPILLESLKGRSERCFYPFND